MNSNDLKCSVKKHDVIRLIGESMTIDLISSTQRIVLLTAKEAGRVHIHVRTLCKINSFTKTVARAGWQNVRCSAVSVPRPVVL